MRKTRSAIVVTAWAESHSGAGWANRLIKVLLWLPDGTLDVRCLQPDEQSEEMRTLFAVSEAAHGSMKRAAERVLASNVAAGL